MAKWILIVVILIMVTPLQANSPAQQTVSSPTDLLPQDTFLYVELPGDFFQMGSWVGERVGVGFFLSPDAENPGVLDFIPQMALVFQVQDETAADAFVEKITQGKWLGLSTPDSTLWREEDLNFGRAIYRKSGYLVLLTNRGLWALDEQNPLSSNDQFRRFQESLSGSPTLMGYFSVGGYGIYTDEPSGFEMVLFGGATEIPDALTESALAAVPPDAVAVMSGTDLSLLFQRLTWFPDKMLEFLSDLDPTLAALPDLPYTLFRTLLGIDYEREFLPLFDGEYAGFLTANVGSDFPLDGGFVLAPEDSANAIFTSGTIINRLEQSGLPIIRLSPTAFSLEVSPDSALYFGFTGGRLYLSTEGGADSIQAAAAGENFTNNRTWQRIFEYAPSGTQQVLYLNLQAAVNLMPAPLQEIDALRQYDSAALFYRMDNEGTHLIKLIQMGSRG